MLKKDSNRHLALRGGTIPFFGLYLYTYLATIINQKLFSTFLQTAFFPKVSLE